jgi:hypothetical protein
VLAVHFKGEFKYTETITELGYRKLVFMLPAKSRRKFEGHLNSQEMEGNIERFP